LPTAWDLKGRLEDTEYAIVEMRQIQAQERIETIALKEQLENHKLRGEGGIWLHALSRIPKTNS
jgi:hypothetical protein